LGSFCTHFKRRRFNHLYAILTKHLFHEKQKIIIAGGTGFIGQELCTFFGDENEITIPGCQHPQLAKNTYGENNIIPSLLNKISFVKWDGIPKDDWCKEIDGAYLVINLTGKIRQLQVHCKKQTGNF